MATEFLVRRDGDITGPFSIEIICRDVRKGALLPETDISNDGVNWCAAAEFTEIDFDRSPIPIRQRFDIEVCRVRKEFLEPNKPYDGYLSAAIDHVAEARTAFVSDARQLTTLVLLPFVAAAVLAASAIGIDSQATTKQKATQRRFEAGIILMGAICCVGFVLPLTKSASAKARAGYQFYVAATIHAAIVHAAARIPYSHQWFMHVYRSMDSIHDCKCVPWKTALTEEWMRTSSSTGRQYCPRCEYENTTNRYPIDPVGNLYVSYMALLRWTRWAAYLAIAMGVAFFVPLFIAS